LLALLKSYLSWASGRTAISNTAFTITFIVLQKLSGDDFVEHLLLPCIRDGTLKRLLDCMQQMDGSLVVWGKYLTAAFIHLTTTKAYHSLYHIQCFAKVRLSFVLSDAN
jgi:hypothetical protein